MFTISTKFPRKAARLFLYKFGMHKNSKYSVKLGAFSIDPVPLAIGCSLVLLLAFNPQLRHLIYWFKIGTEKTQVHLIEDPLGVMRKSFINYSEEQHSTKEETDIRIHLDGVTSFKNDEVRYKSIFLFDGDELSECDIIVDGLLIDATGGIDEDNALARLRCGKDGRRKNKVLLDVAEIKAFRPSDESDFMANTEFYLRYREPELKGFLVKKAPELVSRLEQVSIDNTQLSHNVESKEE